MFGMKDKSGKNVELNLRILIDTNKKAEEVPNHWEEDKPKVDFEFEEGIIAITLPLNACSYKTFNNED